MQKRTASWLVRPYPLGLRFSGKNMSPVPGWLGGAQNVALNMSNNDLAVQIHYAMFKGAGGYVLKPPEMRTALESGRSSTRSEGEQLNREDAYWPPVRESLQCTTIEIFSLHQLPKRSEQRPRYDGSRGGCHKYHIELSGSSAPPDNQTPSCPGLTLSVHPVGGFCAVSDVLPLPPSVESEKYVPAESNGMNAIFGDTVHFVAAEPHATFMRIGVTDGGQEVAYEIAVLGRLRHGYRVFQMRGLLGTRIELCYLFVHITLDSEPNIWASPRQIRMQRKQKRKADADLAKLVSVVSQTASENELLRMELNTLRRMSVDPNQNAELLREPSELRVSTSGASDHGSFARVSQTAGDDTTEGPPSPLQAAGDGPGCASDGGAASVPSPEQTAERLARAREAREAGAPPTTAEEPTAGGDASTSRRDSGKGSARSTLEMTV